MSAEANKVLFCDTDMIYYSVWMQQKFKKSSEIIDTLAEQAQYHYYLLTYPDLPWIPDPLRENENQRQYLFEVYRKRVEQKKTPYTLITGSGGARVEAAKNVINKLLKKYLLM
jgi:nicotinamide riboside kinase